MAQHSSLGTRLRHLIDLLDGAVQAGYSQAGLDYRPRYTPVVRCLLQQRQASISAIAKQAQMTHSAVSQTVAQMVRAKLVLLRPGQDGRERVAELTAHARVLVPALRQTWARTARAADALDEELAYPLSRLINEAIAALEERPFLERGRRPKRPLSAKRKKS